MDDQQPEKVKSFNSWMRGVAAGGALFSFMVFFQLFASGALTASLFLIAGLVLTAAVTFYMVRVGSSLLALELELDRRAQELELMRSSSERYSLTDRVSGLFNRAHFDEVLDNECRRAVREFAPLTMMLVDIDQFAHYRDQYGEAASEQCIRDVAGALAACVSRPGDIVARYDQHRFAFLLPSTNEQVALLAARCCDTVRKLNITHAGAEGAGFVTVSVGVATMQPSRLLTSERLSDAVETAVGRARASGGDHFVASSEGIDDLPPVTYSL